MKLLYEIDSNPSFIVEEELNETTGVSSKTYKIKGVFSTIGEKNRNGRTYPSQLWEREVAKYQENFSSGSLNTLMEWQHPARTNVDPMEAVAKITELKISGNKVLGEAVLLNNPKANQLKSLIDNGIKISVSSRGVGSVKNGIVEDFKLVTYDLVDQPSDFNATMNGMVESYSINEGVLEDLNFKLDENGNIHKVCKDDVCHLFETSEIQKAILEKFSSILIEAKVYKVTQKEFNAPKFQKWIKDDLGDIENSENKPGLTIYNNKAGKPVFSYSKKLENLTIIQNGLTLQQLQKYGLETK